MPTNYRLLTNTEIIGFIARHPIQTLNPITLLNPNTNKYIKDDTLGGYVLIFDKADGKTLYILTPSDPSSTDPSYFGHIAETFYEEAKEQGKYLFKIAGIGVSLTAIIVVSLVLLIYLPDIRKLIKR